MTSKHVSPCGQNKLVQAQPLSQLHHDIRPIGLAKGEFFVPDSFFDELPDDVLAVFAGHAR